MAEPEKPHSPPFNWDHDEPLQKQRNETLRANTALRDYVQMGPGRSLKKLWRKYDESDLHFNPPTRSWKVIQGWSVRYAWQDRTELYSQILMEAKQEKWENRFETHREEEWVYIENLRTRLAQMLKMPVSDISHAEGGKITNIKAAKWQWADVARIAETVSKLARLAAGKSLGRFEFDPERMTNEQLLSRYLQLQEELESASEARRRTQKAKDRRAGTTEESHGDGNGNGKTVDG